MRAGVEVALRRFVDEVDRPGGDRRAGARSTWRSARGEPRAGRRLDALLAAYRVGARVAWRRLVDAATRGRLPPRRSTTSARRSSPTSTRSPPSRSRATPRSSRARAGERERRRRALARLLAADPGARPSRSRTEALARRRWRLPESRAALVGDRPPWRGACPHDASCSSTTTAAWPSSPIPTGPGGAPSSTARRRPRSGPRCRGAQAARSLARARAARALQAAGRWTPRGLVVADEHLGTLLLGAAPELAAELREQALAPLAAERPASREKLVETLRAYLDDPGQPARVAERLGVHPQTVRYRLRRLRELLPEGALDDPDRRFALALALRAP